MSEFNEYRQKKPNYELAKKLKLVAWIVSAVVLVVVGMMRRIPRVDLPFDTSVLPMVNAIVNSIVVVCLLIAIVSIWRRKVSVHRRFISLAMILSGIFLLTYVTYHISTPETIYGDTNQDLILSAEEEAAVGVMRIVYLIILLTHIVLAAVSLPFILFTWIRGFTNQFPQHKRMARWVFPMWLYVAITGPVVFLMLKPYY